MFKLIHDCYESMGAIGFSGMCTLISIPIMLFFMVLIFGLRKPGTDIIYPIIKSKWIKNILMFPLALVIIVFAGSMLMFEFSCIGHGVCFVYSKVYYVALLIV